MTGIHWEWDSPQERYAYDRDMEGDRGFAEEAVVQIDLDLTFEKFLMIFFQRYYGRRFAMLILALGNLFVLSTKLSTKNHQNP